MRHLFSLIAKFIIIAFILEIALGVLTNLSIFEILFVAATVTILTYIIGDLMILPNTSNTVAIISDIVFSAFIIYAFNFILINTQISLYDAFIAGLTVALGEWVFHEYVVRLVLPDDDK